MRPTDLSLQLLNIADAESERLDQLERAGLETVAPVALPEGSYFAPGATHLSHPVAAVADGTVVVAYGQNSAHGNKNGVNEHCTTVMVVRSTDGGESWSAPFDLRGVVTDRTPGADAKSHFPHAIGTTRDGAFVLVTEYGVFRSDDRGAIWRHLKNAFGSKQLCASATTSTGPRLVEHPRYGLVVPCHAIDRSLPRRVPSQLWLRYSRDGGNRWEEILQCTPPFARPAEPAVCVYGQALIIIGRSHADEAYDGETGTWRYTQMWSRDGALPFEAALSSIRSTDATSISSSPRAGDHSQDTVDLTYNPVSRRLEAVVTNRDGGGGDALHDQSCHTLNLWSIDPDALLSGNTEWRFDCTLLRREGTIHGSNEQIRLDGMHPGGAVIDEQRGVQHVFIYLGYRYAPAGIFRISRTLDTARLSRATR